MYETFEHTADLGLRVVAPDLNTLFEDAGRGLFSMLVEDLSSVRLAHTLDLAVEGADYAYLLFDWLNELLYQFETGRWLLADFSVQVTDAGLTAQARGERWDTSRHDLDHEVKAITYHGLRVTPTPDGAWLAEVIVDI